MRVTSKVSVTFLLVYIVVLTAFGWVFFQYLQNNELRFARDVNWFDGFFHGALLPTRLFAKIFQPELPIMISQAGILYQLGYFVGICLTVYFTVKMSMVRITKPSY